MVQIRPQQKQKKSGIKASETSHLCRNAIRAYCCGIFQTSGDSYKLLQNSKKFKIKHYIKAFRDNLSSGAKMSIGYSNHLLLAHSVAVCHTLGININKYIK